MEYVPCIGNSSYSFWRILLKLYRCFKDGLKICILSESWNYFLYFFRNLDIFLYRRYVYGVFMSLTKVTSCIFCYNAFLNFSSPRYVYNTSLQFLVNPFETLQGFKDGLKICILFFQNPEIIFYHFFRIFNLDFEPLYCRYVYGVVPCIGNSSYSFWWIP